MKKNKLLFILSAIALTSCSNVVSSTLNPNGNTNDFQTGVIVNQEQKRDVKKLYNDSLDTTEDLEDFAEDTTVEDTTGENVNDESSNTEPNPEAGTETEIETEPETSITDNISSYHVDYTLDYALSASLEGNPFYTSSEKQTYSLTYVNTDGDVFMELDLTHEYTDTSFFGEYSGKQSINVVFQDETLFVTQEISSPYFDEAFVSKTSHRIKKKHIHKEYSDYFFLMSVNAMLDPTSRENNDLLIEQLLTNETVEIVEVDNNLVKVKFDYEDGVATMVFDTELKAFVSVSFDKSKEKEDITFNTTTNEDSSLIPENNDHSKENPIEEDKNDEFEDNHEHGEHDFKDSPITIDSYRYLVNINFSYNDQIADKLTEEEIAEYKFKDKDYGHHNAYEGYLDDHDYGYHGGRDEDHDDGKGHRH